MYCILNVDKRLKINIFFKSFKETLFLLNQNSGHVTKLEKAN